jgi:hypothetical protein
MTGRSAGGISGAARGGSGGVGTAGVSLAELLVATAVFLLLAGSLLAMIVSGDSGFRTQPASIDVQARLRVAADTLAHEVLGAGSGPAAPIGGLPLGRLVPSVLPFRVGLRGADAPGTFRADLITVIAAVPRAAAPVTTADFEGASGSVSLDLGPGCPVGHPSCGIEVGMPVLLVDASGQSDLYGVTSAGTGTVALTARGAVTGRRYVAGTRIVPVSIATLYLRPPSGAEAPQLARYDGDQSDLPEVDHVVGLAFEYFGDPEPPAMRRSPGPLGDTTTYGPTPPAIGEDDPRDAWGPGENCVVALDGGRQVPRLAILGPAGSALQRLDPGALVDGPWCPDASAPSRFDADLLRIRRVHVTLRVEAWADALRGRDAKLFRRPGTATIGGRSVPDQQVSLDLVPRALGGGR